MPQVELVQGPAVRWRLASPDFQLERNITCSDPLKKILGSARGRSKKLWDPLGAAENRGGRLAGHLRTVGYAAQVHVSGIRTAPRVQPCILCYDPCTYGRLRTTFLFLGHSVATGVQRTMPAEKNVHAYASSYALDGPWQLCSI